MVRRIIVLLIWTIVLFYFTCCQNQFALGFSGFSLSHPRFSDLFMMDIHPLHWKWTVSKIGHFCGFFIEDVLLSRLVPKPKLVAFLVILFAISTEILQLYFSRDGRLYDMVIDSLGVWVSYVILRRSRFLQER